MTQAKQRQWLEQWQSFRDDERFLFEDWIFPNKLDDFVGKSVLEAGCGGGQHSDMVAEYCAKLVAVDLNSVEVAKRRNAGRANVSFIEADIATVALAEQFDIVFSIGVVHHTDDPDITVENLIRHLRKDGRLILCVYSKEGNWISEYVVERFRKLFFQNAGNRLLGFVSRVLTCLMYVPIYTIYLLPLPWLPYFDYFQNFRRLAFERNLLNVFDKLNAPQVQFIDERRIQRWLQLGEFRDVHVSRYKGVSWRVSATRTDS